MNRLVLIGETSGEIFPWLICSQGYAEVYIKHFGGKVTYDKLKGIIKNFGGHIHGMTGADVEKLRGLKAENYLLSFKEV